MVKPKAVYIHIPFCSHKCHYCDFTAYVVEGQPVDQYLMALAKEMEISTKETPPAEIESIFVGGGTPTILTPTQMATFLESIRRYFPNWSPNMEFTMEANPGTVSRELLEVMKKGGVNRLSFGAQTFREDLLKRIGRIHDASEIEQSIYLAREVGFENLSLDLMFGLPTQTVEDIHQAIERALTLKPDHFSCYSLKVEEGTLFHHLYERDQLPLPSEDVEFAMYQEIRKILPAYGYLQYEVSNFAKLGKESVHNSTYWKNDRYYGLGAGAHGYVGTRRHSNLKGITPYIERLDKNELPIQDQYDVDVFEEQENFMMLGLRLMEGISPQKFQKRFGVSVTDVYAEEMKKLVNLGLLKVTENRIFLTEQGLIYGNEVFAEFLRS
ncbi:radical SAM family heme chaperone HemW [Risungbinella massiliensis]|uniref:radical SAM family heme chaperone HemW n=1 Tax=Risungbinella massiliensis TaxID=1329796 RepID=UPI0005CBF731|nr:radical SAM family heme chaperone HemW [Risungbinella massiliensis]